MLDDYREAYWWLAKRTPTDARVMAWWDYGYQIAGIGNRTTIADGNTWNHEHIATLGRILSAPEDKAHRVARHLADYVLVWAGGGGDDLAKSPHMARIGNSVYHDICPGDPTCSQFGFYQGGIPTPMMEKCLLYRMVRSKPPSNHAPPPVAFACWPAPPLTARPVHILSASPLSIRQVRYGEQGVPALDKKRFTHVYTSKYGKVRIFKVMNVSRKSKEWVANPANRVCDAPGSWYCTGQYPPALSSLIAKRKAFKQLEDFNVKGDEASDKYTEEYHKRMESQSGRGGGDYDDYGGDYDDMAAQMGADQMGVAPLGCFGAEVSLGADKVYTGGKTGSQLGLAMQWAGGKRKQYVAIARAGVDGHVFAFNQPPDLDAALNDDDGCDAPCGDIDQFACGCADAVCREHGAGPARGEENARRWVVYQVPAEFHKSASTGSSKKKGKAKKRAPKGEL